MVKKMIATKKKKLTPASITSRPRKAAFLSDDARYLESNPKIELDREIGHGDYGNVFTVAGNKNLVVKIPRGTGHGGNFPMSGEAERSAKQLRYEADNYKKHNLYNKPLIAPMREVNMGHDNTLGRDMIGLVMPRVNDNDLSYLTPSQLEMIRKQLIDLSEHGFILSDGFQVGMDKVGRPLIYDLGSVDFVGDSWSKAQIYMKNNRMFQKFLSEIGLDDEEYYSGSVMPPKAQKSRSTPKRRI